MGNRRVNSITYGAIICALVGALLLINRQMANYLDIYLFWIIPLPVIIYSLKFGSRQAIIMAFAMLFVAVISTGFSITTIFYVVGSILAGLVYGYGVNKGFSSTFLIISVILISLVMAVLTTFVFAAAFGYNVSEEIAWVADGMMKLMEYMNMDADNPAIAPYLNYSTLFQIYVISVVLTSVLEGVLVHLLAYIVLRRLKMTLPPMKPLASIMAPGWVKLFVFASFLAFIVSKFTGITQYDNIITPLITIAQLICFFFGYLLFITLVSLRVRDRRKVTLIVMLVILLFIITAPILVYLGIFDIYSGWRKRLLEGSVNNAQQNG